MDERQQAIEKLLQAAAKHKANNNLQEYDKAIALIRELDASQPVPNLAPTVKPVQGKSTSDPLAFVADKARSGAAQFPTAVSFGIDMLNPISSKPLDKSLSDATTQGREAVAPFVGRPQGYSYTDPSEGTDRAVEAIGSGIEAASDPTNYIGGKGIVMRLMTPFLGGVGANLGASAAREMDGTPITELAGSVIGGALLPSSLVGAAVGIKGAAKGIRTAMSAADSPYIQGKVDQLSSEKVKAVLQLAVKYDPSIAKSISDALTSSQKFGVTLPISSLIDNDIIRQQVRHLLTTNPEFIAAYNQMFKQGKEQLGRAQEAMFGPPTVAREGMESTFKAGSPPYRPKTEWDLKQQKTRIDAELTNRGVAASAPVAPNWMDPDPIKRARNLAEMPIEQLSPKSKPLYEQASAKANELGATLDAGGVQSIYSFLKDEKQDSPFRQFPELWQRIQSTISPTIDPKNPSSRSFDPLTYQQARDLQSAISTKIRELNPASENYRTHNRILNELKNEVDEQMYRSVGPEVASTLKQANMQMAYDATVKQFASHVFDDAGKIDTKKALAWMEDPQNRTAMQRIVEPDSGTALKDTILTPTQMLLKLEKTRGKLGGAYQQAQAVRAESMLGVTADQFINKAYTDQKYLSDVLRKHGNDKSFLPAVRAWMLDDVLKASDPVEFFNDKSKRAALDRVFGPGYSAKVEELATIASRIGRNELETTNIKLKEAAPQDVVAKATGITIPEIISRMRNQIRSKTQSAVELVTKGVTKKAEENADKQMAALLMDPKNLVKAIEELKNIERGKPPTGLLDKTWKLVEQYIIEPRVSSGMGGAMVGAKSGAYSSVQEEEPVEP